MWWWTIHIVYTVITVFLHCIKTNTFSIIIFYTRNKILITIYVYICVLTICNGKWLFPLISSKFYIISYLLQFFCIKHFIIPYNSTIYIQNLKSIWNFFVRKSLVFENEVFSSFYRILPCFFICIPYRTAPIIIWCNTNTGITSSFKLQYSSFT